MLTIWHRKEVSHLKEVTRMKVQKNWPSSSIPYLKLHESSWIFCKKPCSECSNILPSVNVYSLLLKVAIESSWIFPAITWWFSSSLCKRLPGRVFPFKAPWPIFKTSWTSANFCRLGLMFPQHQTQASNLWGIIFLPGYPSWDTLW